MYDIAHKLEMAAMVREFLTELNIVPVEQLNIAEARINERICRPEIERINAKIRSHREPSLTVHAQNPPI